MPLLQKVELLKKVPIKRVLQPRHYLFTKRSVYKLHWHRLALKIMLTKKRGALQRGTPEGRTVKHTIVTHGTLGFLSDTDYAMADH